VVVADKVFAGSIPEIYDRYLVPLIFDVYALDLADRVARVGGRQVLETAAGTGVLTRALASRLPADARLVVTDLNQPMLDIARMRQPADPRIAWKAADALALPFGDQVFDVVTCQFGVMFFPDKVRAYQEVRRVLKPGGRFFFNVWDQISENELADIVTASLACLFPNDPPRFLPRTPHGYHDVACIRAELNAAGFADICVDPLNETSKATSPLDAAIAFCQGTPLRNEIEARDAAGLERATKQAAEALAHCFGSNASASRIRAFVITSTR
jgi:ubiquinone/menaquinone biosynthesis C-methylase UbiE